MDQVYIYLWVMLGIIISVLLPVLWEQVRRYFPAPVAPKAPAVALWQFAKPYVVLGLASALTSILLVAFLGDKLIDYRAALLAGYAWDSTLQKLR